MVRELPISGSADSRNRGAVKGARLCRRKGRRPGFPGGTEVYRFANLVVLTAVS